MWSFTLNDACRRLNSPSMFPPMINLGFFTPDTNCTHGLDFPVFTLAMGSSHECISFYMHVAHTIKLHPSLYKALTGLNFPVFAPIKCCILLPYMYFHQWYSSSTTHPWFPNVHLHVQNTSFALLQWFNPSQRVLYKLYYHISLHIKTSDFFSTWHKNMGDLFWETGFGLYMAEGLGVKNKCWIWWFYTFFFFRQTSLFEGV